VHTAHRATFALPFFHLQGDGFWHLHAFPHQYDWLLRQSTVSSLGVLQAAVEYASLDPELYELLHESGARSALKQVLLAELKSGSHASGGGDCPFCTLPADRKIVAENQLALAFPDRFPVSTGHTLIIPKRHVASYFELDRAELTHIHDLCLTCKDILLGKYHPAGFNVGVNVGRTAGQSIFHCHVHLIPRYCGDVANPRGGVRAVIPGKQDYGCGAAAMRP
jgi:diadenosine tetraphosphate (Ap4A) HIT family hydrolase